MADNEKPRAPGNPLKLVRIDPGRFRPPNLRPVAQDRWAIRLTRAEDLLCLDFEFINLSLNRRRNILERKPGSPAYVVVHFPPQHVFEDAVFETDADDAPLPAPPLKARLAGPSRLAFRIPEDVGPIAFTLDALMTWQDWEPSLTASSRESEAVQDFLDHVSKYRGKPLTSLDRDVVRILETGRMPAKTPSPGIPHIHHGLLRPGPLKLAKPSRFALRPSTPTITGLALRPVIQKPTPEQTHIEAPYRLVLSPNRFSGWAHSVQPVTHGSRAEVWHTRLGTAYTDANGLRRVSEVYGIFKTLRAVWSPDYSANAGASTSGMPHGGMQSSLRHPLRPDDRARIVRLTSDFVGDCARFNRPLDARHLMLSSLGANLDVKGGWPLDNPTGLIGWTHRCAQGRDFFVEIVEMGALWPFGHLALKTTVTERKIQNQTDTGAVAYLKQYVFISVLESVKHYENVDRRMPFDEVHILTPVTPKLDNPLDSGCGWPMVDGKDFFFNLKARDADRHWIAFASPLAWVPKPQGWADSTSLCQHNAKLKRPLHGQTVALAPGSDGKPGDTAFETEKIAFTGEVRSSPAGAGIPGADSSLEPPFTPVVVSANIRVKSLARVAGINTTITVAFDPDYVAHGFDRARNTGEVFLVLDQPVPLAFSADQCGGVATPGMAIAGFSRRYGPVGNGASATAGNPSGSPSIAKAVHDFHGMQNSDAIHDFLSRWFKDAKLLGGIPLEDVVDPNLNSDPHDGKLPAIVAWTDTQSPAGAVEVVQLTWTTGLRPSKNAIFQPAEPSRLTLTTAIRTPAGGSKEPESFTKGDLNDFSIVLPGSPPLVRLNFKKLTFSSTSGGKVDLNAEFSDPPLVFEGVLRFLNALKNRIPWDGFRDPPSLDVSPQGVQAGYSLALPSVGIGAFSLLNISLAASFHLPFQGDPIRFRFAFSERENPFAVAISMFAGGGFFGLDVGPDGVERLEASLEFGGTFALNLGVASGAVYLMAGIYFAMSDNADKTLSGYLRCGGGIEVLGLICVSVQFHMALTWDDGSDCVYGRAEVRVKVEVLFFSKSVRLALERRFSKGTGDPSFADVMAFRNLSWVEKDLKTAGYNNYWELYCDAFADEPEEVTP